MRKWKLFFCHIPKTGGTSLRRALEARLRPSETVPDTDAIKRNGGRYPPLNDALAMARQRADRMRLFRGHYHFSCRHHLPGEFATAVILRDPVERTISLFRHMVAHHGRSAEELIEQLHNGGAIGGDNMMTRFLAGTVTCTVLGKFTDSQHMRGPIRDPDRALRDAIASLDACDYVGTTSNLSALQERLSGLVGRNFDIGVYNVSGGAAPNFTPQEIAMIERHNELDRRLFEYARTEIGF